MKNKYIVYRIPCNSQVWRLEKVCVFYSYDDAYRYCDLKNKRPIDDSIPDSLFNYEFAYYEEV